jgi:hypothetical protein
MKLGNGRSALVVELTASVVLAVLLSPLGFETRPSADLTLLGLISIGAVAVGSLLDLAAIVLLSRRVRLASLLALIGSVVFLVPIVTDQAGAFFSLPSPTVISVLEYVFLVVLIVALPLAWSVHRGAEGGGPSRRDV